MHVGWLQAQASQYGRATCDSEGDRPKAARRVVKIQALIFKQELQLGLTEIVHGIPEVEGCVLAPDPPKHGWEHPGLCIMRLDCQLPV